VDGGYKKRIAQLREDLVHKYHYCNARNMADTEVEVLMIDVSLIYQS
jgi:hypothetical protein